MNTLENLLTSRSDTDHRRVASAKPAPTGQSPARGRRTIASLSAKASHRMTRHHGVYTNPARSPYWSHMGGVPQTSRFRVI